MSSYSRTQTLSNHLPSQSQDDVVICAAVRSPLCKAKKGGFKTASIEDLLTPILKEVINRSQLKDKSLIGDIQIGNVLVPGSAIVQARMSCLLAGIPDTVPVVTVNRQCSSGLQAVCNIFNSIKSGEIECGIGGGVESMSTYDMMGLVDPNKISEAVFENEGARNCLIPMGMTSENVSEKYGLNRIDLDKFSVESHQKAFIAQTNGKFLSEIVPVLGLTKDEGIRKETTLQSLSSLKSSFKKDGSTTAGNASQLTDGSAAVLLAKRSFALKHNLKVVGRFVGFKAVGVPPEIMGIGPAVAIPALLKLPTINLNINSIDLFEINEAFASQATYCINKLQIPNEQVNVNGGAIALGHPLGCTGARQIATIMSELGKRGKNKLGVVSMCIGGGMGAAALVCSE